MRIFLTAIILVSAISIGIFLGCGQTGGSAPGSESLSEIGTSLVAGSANQSDSSGSFGAIPHIPTFFEKLNFIETAFASNTCPILWFGTFTCSGSMAVLNYNNCTFPFWTNSGTWNGTQDVT